MDEEDGEQLEPDESPEATAEAGLTEAGVEPDEDVEFQDDGTRGGPDGGLPLLWMGDALRENGLDVREVQGWRTRGRPHPFLPHGAVFHHTASNRHSGPRPALGTVVKGRPMADGTFLFGPLCNVLVGRNGMVYLVAAGRANHAGLGGPWRTIPVDSGNMYMAGVEVENDGIGEPWRKDLLQVCGVVFATLLIGLGRETGFLVGHKEWAPHRKTDPAQIPMDRYRQQVARRIQAIKRPHTPPAPPTASTLGSTSMWSSPATRCSASPRVTTCRCKR